jgi:hypothetical protein
MPTRKRRVFVSFDFDNDSKLKVFIAGQAKLPDSPFEIVDMSMKEAAPEKKWLEEAEARIKRSDTVLVMLGPKTYKAPGVLKEVRIANRLGKNRFQVIGYRDGKYTPVSNAGRVYAWNWENLKKLLAPVST